MLFAYFEGLFAVKTWVRPGKPANLPVWNHVADLYVLAIVYTMVKLL